MGDRVIGPCFYVAGRAKLLVNEMSLGSTRVIHCQALEYIRSFFSSKEIESQIPDVVSVNDTFAGNIVPTLCNIGGSVTEMVPDESGNDTDAVTNAPSPSPQTWWSPISLSTDEASQTSNEVNSTEVGKSGGNITKQSQPDNKPKDTENGSKPGPDANSVVTNQAQATSVPPESSSTGIASIIAACVVAAGIVLLVALILVNRKTGSANLHLFNSNSYSGASELEYRNRNISPRAGEDMSDMNVFSTETIESP